MKETTVKKETAIKVLPHSPLGGVHNVLCYWVSVFSGSTDYEETKQTSRTYNFDWLFAEWFLIAWEWSHMHMHITHKPGILMLSYMFILFLLTYLMILWNMIAIYNVSHGLCNYSSMTFGLCYHLS